MPSNLLHMHPHFKMALNRHSENTLRNEHWQYVQVQYYRIQLPFQVSFYKHTKQRVQLKYKFIIINSLMFICI